MQRNRGASKLRARKVSRIVWVEFLEDRRLLSTITVNTTADDTAPDATLSLREAIEVSNGTLAVSALSTQEQAQVVGAVGSTNTIGFAIPSTDPGFNASTGVWTITPQTALPAITTNAAIIDGYTQAGASRNTLAQADDAKLTIAISGSSLQISGLTIASPGSRVSGLDMENFAFDGLLITAPGNVQVTGNFVGTDPTGEVAAHNGNGVEIQNSNNTIGGLLVGDRNVISGNGSGGEGDGILMLQVANVTGTLVVNNFIGTDATGTKAVPNALEGVEDHGTNNTYGGTTAGLGNVISGNGEGGLRAFGSITVEGNQLGTDPTGSVGLGNGALGIGVDDSGFPNVVIMSTITNNVVSGNRSGGIDVSSTDPDSTFTISNNKVGTNAAGTAALPNNVSGLSIDFVKQATVDDNLISGNTGPGINFDGLDATVGNSVFQGNKIGTDITGLLPLGNTFAGVKITSVSGIVFGGPGAGQANVVAFNGENGVDVLAGNGSSKQVQITQNSIFGNTGRGIFLDSNGSSNNSAVAPVITFTPTGGGNGTLAGTITPTTTPQNPYTVEIFSNPTTPAAGHEQGKTFVEAVPVTVTSGVGSFSVSVPAGIYTATSTDSVGNTSQFSLPAGAAALDDTVTTLTSSSNPSAVGQFVVFAAVVTAPGFAGNPTGTVTFNVDGTAQTPVPLTLNQAQLTTSTLAAGAHMISATYNGDSTFATSTATLPTQTVNAPILEATVTTVSAFPNPSTVGQLVLFDAVVSAPGFQGTPTGTVTFTINGQAQTPVPLQVLGTHFLAQLPITSTMAGAFAVTATYNGDSTFAPSTGSLPTQGVNEGISTTTTVASSANPSTVGQPVTFTAVLATPGATGTPTGTMVFTIDGQVPPTVVALTVVGGVTQAQFTTSTLTAGVHTVSVSYGGDATFRPSSATLPTQTVNAASQAATTTSMISLLNPSKVGQPVTFIAVVSSPAVLGSPMVTGTVIFTIDGQAQAPVPVGTFTVDTAQAQFTTSTLAAGAHTVSAAYSGDSNFGPSSATLPTQTVSGVPLVATTTVLTAAPNPSTFGQSVVLTAKVTSADGSPPSGTVTFKEGTTTIGSGVVGANGTATFTDTSLVIGSNAITATYGGDPGHGGSVSTAVTQVVESPLTAAPTIVSLQRFGFHMQPTSLVLTFSVPLDAASARRVSNYQVVPLGGETAGHAITVARAVYDPSTSTVTLYPAHRLNVHHRYRLTVNGTSSTGVRSATGLLLDGKGSGKAGSNYVATIDRQTLAGPAPSLSAKHASGPSATGFDALAATGELGAIGRQSGNRHPVRHGTA